MDKNDLISRSELKKTIISICGKCSNIIREYKDGVPDGNCAIQHIMNMIDNALPVEYPFYQEAYQTGYEEGKNERLNGEWKCPECGEWLFACPNCGADMRQNKEPDKQITIEEYMQSLKGE